MHKLLTGVLTLTLCFSTFADDAAKPKKNKKQAKANPQVERLFAVPKAIELTEEQQKEIATLKKEWAPKAAEAVKSVFETLPKEKRKARAEARKKAAEDGKKGKELKEAVDNAVDLTEEEAKAFAAAEKKANEVRMTIRKAVMGVLTKEQKAQLRKKPKE